MAHVNPSHMAHFIQGATVGNYEEVHAPDAFKPAARWDSRSDGVLSARICMRTCSHVSTFLWLGRCEVHDKCAEVIGSL